MVWMRVRIYLSHDVNSGKKHSNQIQHSVPMEEFPTLQWAWRSIIPGSNIKGLISGVHKISWSLKTESNSLTHAKVIFRHPPLFLFLIVTSLDINSFLPMQGERLTHPVLYYG